MDQNILETLGKLIVSWKHDEQKNADQNILETFG